MRHWIVLTVVGLALVASMLLPLGPSRWAQPNTSVYLDDPQEVARYRALSKELRSLQAVVDRRRWADSLSAVAFAAADRGDVALAGPEGLVPADAMARVRERIDEEIAALGPMHEDVALGFFVQPRPSLGPGSSLARDGRVGTELFVGRRDRRTFCLNVLVAPADRLEGERRDLTSWLGEFTVLDICHLVARFGHPGPAIREWLETGGATYGMLPAGHAITRFRLRDGGETAPFGIRTARMGPTLAYERCLVGEADQCGAVFVDPQIGLPSIERYAAPRSDFLRSSFDNAAPVFGLIDRYMLADLADEFGPERFERFWTSAAPVGEAFEDAFDTTPGEWMLAWNDGNGIRRAGPAVQEAHLPGSMLFLVLCGAVAAWWVGRWRVA